MMNLFANSHDFSVIYNRETEEITALNPFDKDAKILTKTFKKEIVSSIRAALEQAPKGAFFISLGWQIHVEYSWFATKRLITASSNYTQLSI